MTYIKTIFCPQCCRIYIPHVVGEDLASIKGNEVAREARANGWGPNHICPDCYATKLIEKAEADLQYAKSIRSGGRNE